MTSDDSRRNQLSRFLRERRASLQPHEVGLPARTRTRTEGLRRDDVALLSGVSTSWYTALEQGRDVRPSDRVLSDLSRVLRLSSEEREFLYALAQNRPPPLVEDEQHNIPESALRLLRAFRLPAYILNICWDVLIWNEAAVLCFGDFAAIPPSHRNVLKLLLSDPVWQADPEEYDNIVRRVIAKLRLDFSRSTTDPSLQALIAELTETSPTFRRIWASNLVSRTEKGIHTYKVEGFGPITMENSAYALEEDPTLRLVMFSPVGPQDAEILARLVG